jgi:hypothetical protein
VPGAAMSFSSFPAVLYSFDDWYVTSANLVVSETTIINNNASLWELLTPHSVPEWLRNMLANRLASSGQSWVDAFSPFNSGTYNNGAFSTFFPPILYCAIVRKWEV